MPRRRMPPRGWFGKALGLAALLGAGGCSSIEGYPIHWPWTKTAMLAEKYDLPPQEDTRYVNPPTYPKETMAAQLKVKEDKPGQRAFAGTTGMGPGGMPGGR